MTGSPKSRPRVAQQWPRGAEGQRRQMREIGDDGREIAGLALAAIADNNPQLTRVYVAMMETLFADIQRLAVEARIGAEPPAKGEQL